MYKIISFERKCKSSSSSSKVDGDDAWGMGMVVHDGYDKSGSEKNKDKSGSGMPARVAGGQTISYTMSKTILVKCNNSRWMGIYEKMKHPVKGHFAYQHQEKDAYLWAVWTADLDWIWCIGDIMSIGTNVCYCISKSKNSNSQASPVGSFGWQKSGLSMFGTLCWRPSSITVCEYSMGELPNIQLHDSATGPVSVNGASNQQKNELLDPHPSQARVRNEKHFSLQIACRQGALTTIAGYF
jgi:hypothetical protein